MGTEDGGLRAGRPAFDERPRAQGPGVLSLGPFHPPLVTWNLRQRRYAEPTVEMNPRRYLLAAGLGAALALCGCTATRTLTVSPSNPAAPTEEAGVPCLRSAGTNPVTLWLLSPHFRATMDDLSPPAFRVLVKNGGAQAFAFSPDSIAAFSGGTAVHVLAAEEYVRAIDAQAVALERLTDVNVAQARQKLDAYEALAAIATPGQTAGANGPMYDFSTVPHPDTDIAKAQLSAMEKSRRDEIEAWRQRLLDDAQAMLDRHTVAPGTMAGGVIRLAPEDVAPGRPLKLTITAGGETHEFLFDVGR